MGLDMYLMGKKFFWHDAVKEHCDGFEIEQIVVKLGYWRKHSDLHGFIVQNFAEGKDDCKEIGLDADQINQLIEAIKMNELPPTEGFFFGASARGKDDKGKPTEEAHKELMEQMDEDIKIFSRALAWLARISDADKHFSWSVVYRASW